MLSKTQNIFSDCEKHCPFFETLFTCSLSLFVSEFNINKKWFLSKDLMWEIIKIYVKSHCGCFFWKWSQSYQIAGFQHQSSNSFYFTADFSLTFYIIFRARNMENLRRKIKFGGIVLSALVASPEIHLTPLNAILTSRNFHQSGDSCQSIMLNIL